MAKEKPGRGGRQSPRLSRRQQESRWQRFIFAAGIFVIALVLALMGTGWYLTQVKPFHEIAFKVNDTEIDMRFYVDTLVVSGPTTNMEESIEQHELIRQAALKMGITVSNEEARAGLEKKLKDSGLPVTDRYAATLKYEILNNKLLDEYFEEKTPITAPQREFLAMFLESESQANEIRDRILAGEDFGELAATLSLDTTSQDGKGNIGWHPKGVLSAVVASSVLDEKAWGIETGVLSQPIADANKSKNVGYWLFKVLEKEGEEAKIQVMLLGTGKEAQDIRARLEAGEDFVTLAKEVSQMPGAKADGGDIGLIKKGERGALFDSYIFDPDVAAPALSQPVYDGEFQTKGGYWLVKPVAEANDKVISNEDRKTLRFSVYYDWVAALWNDSANKRESYLTDDMKNWAMEAATRERRAISARAQKAG